VIDFSAIHQRIASIEELELKSEGGQGVFQDGYD